MPLDKEKAKRNLEVIREKMHADTDIAALHEYYKLYKKEISFFKRSWAAAWLFMYYNQRETPKMQDTQKPAGKKPEKTKIEKTKLDKTKPVQEKPEKTKLDKVKLDKVKLDKVKPAIEINLTDEESRRLFISIGKNRRLFPREVITLIMSKTSAAREDIGIIRILDNYSFVQVKDTKADEIIEKLTGHRFRGRTLTVNYAKPKTSDGESE